MDWITNAVQACTAHMDSIPHLCDNEWVAEGSGKYKSLMVRVGDFRSAMTPIGITRA